MSGHPSTAHGDEDCILGGIEFVPKPTVGMVAAGWKGVMVFGIDLSEYVNAPSDETPFERFLNNEDRLGEMASLPCLDRGCKL